MGRIYSVRIIRENKHALHAIYQKEFWMLCGVYVREYVVDRDSMQTNDLEQEVDCNIFINQTVWKKWKNRAKARYDFVLKGATKFKLFNTAGDRKRQGNSLMGLLNAMGKQLKWDKALKDQFQKILSMFITCDYAYNEYKFHLFVSQMREGRDALLETYKNCLNQLLEKDELGDGQYIQFAYINCARKYERICSEDGKIGYFVKKDLMYKAHDLTKEDEKFTSGDMLAGMIGLSYHPLWEEGEKYLKSAIEKEKEQKHCAFMYYALGHFYEWQRENWEKACREYEKIEKVDAENYRMIYKKACKVRKDGEIEKAIVIFRKIYVAMKERAESGWISPTELEYFYKCANFLNVHGLVSERTAQEIKQKGFEASNFVNKFFEINDIKVCKDMLTETMENRGKYCK